MHQRCKNIYNNIRLLFGFDESNIDIKYYKYGRINNIKIFFRFKLISDSDKNSIYNTKKDIKYIMELCFYLSFPKLYNHLLNKNAIWETLYNSIIYNVHEYYTNSLLDEDTLIKILKNNSNDMMYFKELKYLKSILKNI